MVLRIRKLRQAIGLDQIQFGQAIGVAQGTVSDWENERYLPKTRDLPLLAQVLGVPIGELFEDPDMTNHITELGA